jgi:3-phenylpropionate/cinnamic acid dioxygenase small subunit
MNDLADRTSIIDVTIHYCWSIDARQWNALAEVFLPDAVAVLGRECQGLDAIRARISEALTPLDDSQHMVSNHQVRVDGDTATCRCYLQAQHVRHAVSGSPNFLVGGRYEDELVRTPAGWRIARRELVVMWRDGNPDVVRRDG